MLKNHYNSIYQYMVLVYFTAGLAICGMMVNRSIASELPLAKQHLPALNTGIHFDEDTVIYNHFIQ